MDEFSNGKDIFNRSNRFYRDHDERFWIGTMFGMFVMLLVVLVYSKLAEQPDARVLPHGAKRRTTHEPTKPRVRTDMS